MVKTWAPTNASTYSSFVTKLRFCCRKIQKQILFALLLHIEEERLPTNGNMKIQILSTLSIIDSITDLSLHVYPDHLVL